MLGRNDHSHVEDDSWLPSIWRRVRNSWFRKCACTLTRGFQTGVSPALSGAESMCERLNHAVGQANQFLCGSTCITAVV